MVLFFPGTHPLEQDVNKSVLELAAGNNIKLYLVGGYLRDCLIGRITTTSKDFDYAVLGGSAINFAKLVSEKLSGHFVLLDESSDCARVVFDDGVTLDFSLAVGGSIESDIMRRDFTVNALAWDSQKSDEIIDLVGGINDLKQKKIKAISEQNFQEDPLRLLRAFRFATALNATIDDTTMKWISANAKLISSVAAERINYEFFLMMEKPAAAAVCAMGDIGLLEEIFPELCATRKVTPNAYHHLDLWQHSLELITQAENRLSMLPTWAQESLKQELSANVSYLSATKVACLLHDIGKPDTWVITDQDRHTFYGHDALGAEMTEKTAQRLKWARPLERFIVKLIRWHLRPGQLFHQGPPTTKAIHRFYRTIGSDLPGLMLLAFADLGATCGAGIEGPQKEKLFDNLNELLQEFFVFESNEKSMVRLLDGNEIMSMLQIQPGPALGQLLEALKEAQGLGEVSNRQQAESFIKDAYTKKVREIS